MPLVLSPITPDDYASRSLTAGADVQDVPRADDAVPLLEFVLQQLRSAGL